MHDQPPPPPILPISGVSLHTPSVHMRTTKELHGYTHALEEIEGMLLSICDAIPGPGKMAGWPM